MGAGTTCLYAHCLPRGNSGAATSLPSGQTVQGRGLLDPQLSVRWAQGQSPALLCLSGIAHAHAYRYRHTHYDSPKSHNQLPCLVAGRSATPFTHSASVFIGQPPAPWLLQRHLLPFCPPFILHSEIVKASALPAETPSLCTTPLRPQL